MDALRDRGRAALGRVLAFLGRGNFEMRGGECRTFGGRSLDSVTLLDLRAPQY